MIHTVPRIVRHRARDEVSALLRDMILSGELASDARLEEVELSARIGLSRTPIREALITLEAEGLVQSRPNKGFVVARADVDLVRETFPILSALEAEAVRLTGERLHALVPALAELNSRLAVETDPARQYALDHQFHEQLTADCRNPRLLELLAIERTRARRFDGAELKGTADREGSCSDHAEILAAIGDGRFDKAAAVLRGHWKNGVKVVVAWLEARA